MSVKEGGVHIMLSVAKSCLGPRIFNREVNDLNQLLAPSGI